MPRTKAKAATQSTSVIIPDSTLTISASALKSAVGVAKAFISSRLSHPILACFLVKLDVAQSTITGFDLSNSVELELQGNYQGNPTSFCVSAQLFADAVNCLDGEVHLTVEETTLLLKAGKTKYKLACQSADGYPALPEIESVSVELPSSLMSDIVRLAEFASSKETRQVLTGVKVVIVDQLAEVAVTDGHRLHWFNQQIESEGELDAIIPASALKLLNKLIVDEPAVSVAVDEAQMKVAGNDWSFTSRLLEGQYPNYKQLIPTEFGVECEIDKANLIAALQACSVVDVNGIFAATLSESGMRVFRSSADVGDFDQIIDATLKGGEIEIAGDLRYFIAALKLLSGERATLYLNSHKTPVVIKAEGCKFNGLVMPVQLRN